MHTKFSGVGSKKRAGNLLTCPNFFLSFLGKIKMQMPHVPRFVAHSSFLFLPPPSCFLGVWWESGWVGNGVKVGARASWLFFFHLLPQNHEGTIGTEKFIGGKNSCRLYNGLRNEEKIQFVNLYGSL